MRSRGEEPMPKAIPMEQVIDVVVFYLAKRQIQGRPTTLRQLSKRVGLGAPTVKAELEKHMVQYILIPYGDRIWVTSSIEIVLVTMPEKLAARNGFKLEDIEASYNRYFGEEELEPLDDEGEVEDIDPVTNMDPYAPYRITTRQYQALKHELISFPELIREGQKRGYAGRAIERATGGNRMRYALPGPLWRPYVYRNHRYYMREVLNYLHQAFATYKLPGTADLKSYRRRVARGEYVPTKLQRLS
jgi:hypothetical protein